MLVSCWTLPLLEAFFLSSPFAVYALILPLVPYFKIWLDIGYRDQNKQSYFHQTSGTSTSMFYLNFTPKPSIQTFLHTPPKKYHFIIFGPYISLTPSATHTHTTLWDLKLHLSIHQVAFQMGSGDWVTLSQWRGTWIHDQILAPWVLTSTEGAKAWAWNGRWYQIVRNIVG